MTNKREIDEKVIESELKGKTFLVYLYLLKRKDKIVGVREMQRALNFSSPSLVAYHLEKLLNLGLVKKNISGEYMLRREIKVGILPLFSQIGRILIPRHLFYAILFTTMTILYIIFYGITGSIHSIIALLFGTLATIILWFETIKIWREKPF